MKPVLVQDMVPLGIQLAWDCLFFKTNNTFAIAHFKTFTSTFEQPNIGKSERFAYCTFKEIGIGKIKNLAQFLQKYSMKTKFSAASQHSSEEQ